MEKLICFKYESQSNSVALFKAVNTPISCPQIFAGHNRGEDFNLVPDVGSSEENETKGIFVPARRFTGNGTYRLGTVSQLQCANATRVFKSHFS